jgi:SAM-dependent methyltransferase
MTENTEYYNYPDKNDKLTLQFIKEKEGDGKYWVESESQIIDLITSYFEKYLPKESTRFLDAGCGNGRLIPRFVPYFDSITAIEPDKTRFEKAKELVVAGKLDSKVFVYNLGVMDYLHLTAKPFDFILSSHVIQHINSKSVYPMLEGLVNLLNKNALLAITTCHSVRSENYFVKSHLHERPDFSNRNYGKRVQ